MFAVDAVSPMTDPAFQAECPVLAKYGGNVIYTGSSIMWQGQSYMSKPGVVHCGIILCQVKNVTP